MKYHSYTRPDVVRFDQLELFYTIAYILISICLIHPPTEFVAAGLTVQNLFSNFLGSEQMHFVYYHMKRTTATVVFHSFLPLGKFHLVEVFIVTSYSNNFGWSLSTLGKSRDSFDRSMVKT